MSDASLNNRTALTFSSSPAFFIRVSRSFSDCGGGPKIGSSSSADDSTTGPRSVNTAMTCLAAGLVAVLPVFDAGAPSTGAAQKDRINETHNVIIITTARGRMASSFKGRFDLRRRTETHYQHVRSNRR